MGMNEAAALLERESRRAAQLIRRAWDLPLHTESKTGFPVKGSPL